MKRWLLVLVLVACRKPAVAPSQPLLESIRSEARAGKAPALVVLHGLGSNERDLFSLGKALAPDAVVIGLRAPLVRGPDSFSWFPVQFTPQGPVHDAAEAERSRVRIVEFVRALQADPSIDGERITLLGFSQGAILSEAVALTEPGLISGAVLISGRTLPEVKPVAGATRRPRVLVLHGTRDTVLPYENGVTTNEVLTSAGYDVEFKAFDAAHEISGPMVEAMRAWLASFETRR